MKFKVNTRLAVAGGAGLVLLLVASWQYRSWSAERAEVVGEIARVKKEIADRDREMEGRARIKREMARLAETTLGSDEETVTATVRTALNEIAAHYGLSSTSVTSNRAVGHKNPAAEARAAEFNDKKLREERERPDFYSISASLNGTGTLEQATRTMATLESQPWVHRIEKFDLKPVGKEREQIELSVILTTVYLTDADLRKKAVLKEGERAWRPVEEAEYAVWRPLVAKNVFREPPPAPAAPVAAAPAPTNAGAPEPPQPARVAWEEWRVSGIARGTGGAQLMLVNDRTKEWKTVSAGGMVLEAKFVDGSGETARIAIGEAEFEVKTGQRLSERRLVAK